MGIINSLFRNREMENEIQRKLAQSELFDDLLYTFFEEKAQPWFVERQGYYDNGRRMVEVGCDWVVITWRKDGEEPVEFGIGLSKSGYEPLKPHVNSWGIVDVTLTRVCVLFASILKERFEARMPNFEFRGVFENEEQEVATFYYDIPAKAYKSLY